MPGAPHESMVILLHEHPTWLRALVAAVTHRMLPEALTVVDAAIRVVDPAEVRVDLLLATADGSYWIAVEVQLEADPAKARKWPLTLAALWNERGVPGDLLVVTADRAVAEWARGVGRMTGPLGTRLIGEPVVLQLTGDVAEALLDPTRPELAFFAVWTVHDRYGPEALAVVERAAELIETIPDEALRRTLQSLILGMLHEKLLQKIREASMNLDQIPKSAAYLKFVEDVMHDHGPAIEARGEAKGKVRGEAEALLTVLGARGLTVDEARRTAVLATRDLAVLERWIVRAATATTLD